MNTQDFHICGQTFLLNPLKAIYWMETKTVLVADLHLGKDGHFRQAGIAVPDRLTDVSLQQLDQLVSEYKADRLLILGDLFHSSRNKAWDLLESWIANHSQLQSELIPGNHDFHSHASYEALGLTVRDDPWEEGPFLFSHIPLEEHHPGLYNLAGHIHPAVVLAGEGRQRLKLPCFYFGERQGLLPAFGAFTGMAQVYPKDGERVFVIGEGRVFGV